jgi:hypothetical protein
MASPQCPTRCFTRALSGSIFIRCVHQRKVRSGGGWPCPMMLTQKDSPVVALTPQRRGRRYMVGVDLQIVLLGISGWLRRLPPGPEGADGE